MICSKRTGARKVLQDLVEKIGGIHNEGPYTPYSSKEYRVIFSRQQGGPNYGGVAVDPVTNYVFVNTRDVAGLGRLDKAADDSPVAYRRSTPLPGRGTFYSRFWDRRTKWRARRRRGHI